MGTGDCPSTRLARMHDVMAGHVERRHLPGWSRWWSRRGEVVVDTIGRSPRHSAPMRRDTIFRIASMTKPVIAAAR